MVLILSNDDHHFNFTIRYVLTNERAIRIHVGKQLFKYLTNHFSLKTDGNFQSFLWQPMALDMERQNP